MQTLTEVRRKAHVIYPWDISMMNVNQLRFALRGLLSVNTVVMRHQ